MEKIPLRCFVSNGTYLEYSTQKIIEFFIAAISVCLSLLESQSDP